MTEYETLIYEIHENNVAVITLNRPEKLNTFTIKMAQELDQLLLELDNDQKVRVVIVKGSGRAFCAGIDVNELNDRTTMEYREIVEIMEHPFVTISRMKKPVIAQVHGVAAANGMGLIASADLAVASEDARMGLTAINVGLNCVGPVVPVARSVGRKKALEMLFYGELLSAADALQEGLINKVVAKDELNEQTMAWAEKLAAKSPIAVQLAKEAFYSSEDMDYEKQFAFMNEAFARLCTTEDAKEGVKAFFEKRKPEWKER